MWSIFTWFFHEQTRAKHLLRLINDASLSHITKLEVSKLQYLLGTTDQVYRTWAKNNGTLVAEEEIGQNAKLYWLGRKQSKRVILYLHGMLSLDAQGRISFVNAKYSRWCFFNTHVPP